MINTPHHRVVKIAAEGIEYYVKVIGAGAPLICLHGFAEDHSTWNSIEFTGCASYRIDLIGHGISGKPTDSQPYQWDAVLKQLHQVIQNLTKEPYTLLGYSMGGRIALAYALKYQKEMAGLIIESAGIGIEDEELRSLRCQSDCQLAENIVKNGIQWFNKVWSKMPIFDTQQKLSHDLQCEIAKRRLQNSADALANILQGCGQGKTAYYGEMLYQLQLPVLYISGEEDHKYSQTGKDFTDKCLRAVHVQVPSAGHNVHLEQPIQFQENVESFLLSKGEKR